MAFAMKVIARLLHIPGVNAPLYWILHCMAAERTNTFHCTYILSRQGHWSRVTFIGTNYEVIALLPHNSKLYLQEVAFFALLLVTVSKYFWAKCSIEVTQTQKSAWLHNPLGSRNFRFRFNQRCCFSFFFLTVWRVATVRQSLSWRSSSLVQ